MLGQKSPLRSGREQTIYVKPAETMAYIPMQELKFIT